jgi:hypothetical protein
VNSLFDSVTMELTVVAYCDRCVTTLVPQPKPPACNYFTKPPQLLPAPCRRKFVSYGQTKKLPETAMTTSPNAGELFKPSPADGMVASALDELASGVIIVDRQGRVHYRNWAADAVLLRGDSVSIVAGIISASHDADAPQFSEALSNAAAGTRSLVTLGPTSVSVMPLRGSQDGEQRLVLMFSPANVHQALTQSFAPPPIT